MAVARAGDRGDGRGHDNRRACRLGDVAARTGGSDAPVPQCHRAAAGHPLNVSGSDRDVALSPDGQHVVYRAGGTTTNGSPLHVRSRDQVEARALADISLAYAPFFSPDSQWIGFFDNTQLKKVSLAGGPVSTIGPVTGRSLGASWGDDNTIVFATDDPGTGLWSVSADGGEPNVLTRPVASQREVDHRFPSVLPNGRGVLFTIVGPGAAGALVAVLDLKTGKWKKLATVGASPSTWTMRQAQVRVGTFSMRRQARCSPCNSIRSKWRCGAIR